MKRMIPFLIAICFCFVFFLSVSAQQQEKQTKENRISLGCYGVKDELAKAATEASKRTLDALSSGGLGNPSDLRLTKAFNNACIAGEVQRVLADSPAYIKSIRKELIEKAREASNRVLTEYHKFSGNPPALRRDDIQV